ncbi:DUF2771 domain-containing protein [Kibdelosporangium philippinense]|uniref:DUF2771 domain-containing protein n=1 Tax=Kibdelosporangium philippinense TaxID=211113 RepID=A0ABS8ZRH4_9PSEU|nr:DUF2771 family protein [Kibdelosporangium philippinense]MCE7009063.1 DUF2771 domain-containing protein [Kibdelosporangium philippinense]
MRRFAIASLLAGGLLLAGCAAPHDPEVTFFADGETVNIGPSPVCDVALEECKPTGSLAVPGGMPLNISVPKQIADAPWVVVFRYRAADGSVQKARSSLFRSGGTYAYTLRTPTAGDQLMHVEVQRIGEMGLDTNQELYYRADGSWALTVSP